MHIFFSFLFLTICFVFFKNINNIATKRRSFLSGTRSSSRYFAPYVCLCFFLYFFLFLFLLFLLFYFVLFVFLYSFSPSFFQSSIIIAGSFRVSLFIDLGWVRTRFGETLGNQFYRLQTKLRKSNVFTSVCQEFCQQGEGVHPPGQTPPADTPRQIASPSDTPLGRHPLRQTPSPSQLTTPPPPPNQAATAPDSTVSTVLECILVLSRLFNSNQHSSVDRASGYSHTHDRSQLKRSAGVTPEVKLREHVTRTPRR